MGRSLTGLSWKSAVSVASSVCGRWCVTKTVKFYLFIFFTDVGVRLVCKLGGVLIALFSGQKRAEPFCDYNPATICVLLFFCIQ